MHPPKAKTVPHQITAHGHTRVDNFYWLRDKDNPEVQEYLRSENDFANHLLQHTETLQQQLFEEIKARIPQTDDSVPFQFDNYFYYSRIENGQNYPVFCRKKHHLDAQEEILLNVNQLAEGHTYYSVGMYEVSADENLLAFAVDTAGDSVYTVYFKDLQSNSLLPDVLHNVCFFTWSNNNQTLYYTAFDRALRPYKVLKHTLGTLQKSDVLIFHEKNRRFACMAYRTQSKDYILIDTESSTTSEVWYFSASGQNDRPQLFQRRKRNMEYSIDHFGNHFYILTNYKAPNFRLMRTLVQQTGIENWEEVIPHRKNVLLEDFHIFSDFLVLEERSNGLPQIRVKGWHTDADYYLPFSDATYVASVGDNYLYHTHLLRYVYTSLHTPTSVYDFNMETRQQTLLKQYEVNGNFNPANYHTEYLFVKSENDKFKIPVSLVYRKDLFKKDGSNPMLLYAYGAYGLSSEPYFSYSMLSLIDRGFVYAIAHVRGGEEMGRHWYEQGKLLKKHNSFSDFADCAQYFINQNYTNPSKMVFEGGSAGGLLVASVINHYPNLCAAAILQVPFVDVLTTMLDEELPLTIGEYDEWGNPKVQKYYNYMLSYSPYDNIKPQHYPHLLITTGLNDANVQYWEPVKYVAKLRQHKQDNNLLLLKIDMESGHQGASGRYDSYKESALEFAFILHALHLT
ncbi:S9 family peptidase [Sphingobacteriales bacterium UPWRP_1]|nr:oligopeptidase B [Sphingobacteriales bacterium TSM_CSS]PSJ77381.1 S9 family peptidase [Sphingobacteriales bacterium UPWRP_1]